LNVSGPETTAVAWLAQAFADRLGKPALLEGQPEKMAWLINTAQATKLFGYPMVPLHCMVDWVASWILGEGGSLGKPTHFEVRDGNY
jgi:hypothetical protein